MLFRLAVAFNSVTATRAPELAPQTTGRVHGRASKDDLRGLGADASGPRLQKEEEAGVPLDSSR